MAGVASAVDQVAVMLREIEAFIEAGKRVSRSGLSAWALATSAMDGGARLLPVAADSASYRPAPGVRPWQGQQTAL